MKTLYKKIIIFSVIVFGFTNIKAQENPWSISAFYTPSLSNTIWKLVSDSGLAKEGKKSLDSTKIYSYSYATGINFGYRLKDIEISTGIEYHIISESSKYFNQQSPTTELDSRITSITSYRFFSLPIAIKYHIFKEKFKLYALVAADYRYLSHYGLSTINKIYQTGTNELLRESKSDVLWKEITDLDSKRKHHFWFRAGIGSSFSLSERLSIDVEPSFNISFHRLNKTFPSALVKQFPYSFGLKTGIAWNF
jgi:hypothetical protein